jgi:hypothetical protein
VHRIRAAALARVDDLVDDEVALRRGGRPDVHGGVGHLDVGCEPIDVAEDRNRLETAFPTRTHHPNGDFSTVGDEDTTDRR